MFVLLYLCCHQFNKWTVRQLVLHLLRGVGLICIVAGSTVIFILFVLTGKGDLSEHRHHSESGWPLPSPIWIEHTLSECSASIPLNQATIENEWAVLGTYCHPNDWVPFLDFKKGWKLKTWLYKVKVSIEVGNLISILFTSPVLPALWIRSIIL